MEAGDHPGRAVAAEARFKAGIRALFTINAARREAEANPTREKQFQYARALEQGRRWNSALRILAILANEDGDDLKFQYEHAWALMKLGRASEAMPILARIAQLFPEKYAAQQSAGLAAFSLREYAVAVDYFERALDAEPERVVAAGLHAVCLAASGSVDRALWLARVLHANNPEDPAVSHYLGEVYRMGGLQSGLCDLLRDESYLTERYFYGILDLCDPFAMPQVALDLSETILLRLTVARSEYATQRRPRAFIRRATRRTYFMRLRVHTRLHQGKRMLEDVYGLVLARLPASSDPCTS